MLVRLLKQTSWRLLAPVDAIQGYSCILKRKADLCHVLGRSTGSAFGCVY